MRRVLVTIVIVFAASSVSAQEVLVWDPTNDLISGPSFVTSLTNNGFPAFLTTEIDTVLDLTAYRAVFCCLGSGGEYHLLPYSVEDLLLTDYLVIHNGHLYLEGQTFWLEDTLAQLHLVLGAELAGFHPGDFVDSLHGIPGTRFEGFIVEYTGSETPVVEIQPTPSGGAFPIWEARTVGGSYPIVGVQQIIKDSLVFMYESITTTTLFGNDAEPLVEARDEVVRAYLDALMGPEVEIINPNGGELFSTGEQIDVVLTISDDVGVDSTIVSFSSNGGGMWNDIAVLFPPDTSFVWIVPTIPPSTDCVMRAQTWDVEGLTWSDNTDLPFTVPVADGNTAALPIALVLHSHPNPFNPSTVFSFDLPCAGRARVEVYDVLGRAVETLIDSPLSAGTHHIVWDAGSRPSGIYFARLSTQSGSVATKTVLLR
jgi:hypothetical protein